MSIEITGLGDILERLERLERMEGVQAAVMAAGMHVKGVVDDYPPSSEANSPTQRRWYERGYGPRWRVKSGAVHGSKTSQMLGRRWTVRPLGATSVVVGNNVSYGPFVQDEEKQARFHKRRGWKTVQQVAKQETETVRRFVESYLRRLIGQ
jgi:hypothetical protein